VTDRAQDPRGPQQTQRTATARSGGGVAFGSFNPTTITDARSGASEELARRQRRYAITMAFRTACFIAMIFAPGVFRWILFGCAVFLPYVAVIFANQANQRSAGSPVGAGDPVDAPAITAGPEQHEVITGDVEESRDDRVA
jgi:Protein of unknown function (DUF3099)